MALDLLTLPECAAMLRYSISRTRELYRFEGLPALRTGRRGQKVLFSRAAVERWLLRRSTGATGPRRAAARKTVGPNPTANDPATAPGKEAAPREQQLPRGQVNHQSPGI